MKVKRVRNEVPAGGNHPVLLEEYFDLEPHEVLPGDIVFEAHPAPVEEIQEEDEDPSDFSE